MYLIRRIKLCLELHGSLSSVISVKVLVNVLKIVEERVRYFNNGGPFIRFRVSPAWEDAENIVFFICNEKVIKAWI